MCAICRNKNHGPAFSRRNFLKLTGAAAAGMAFPVQSLFAAGEAPKPQNVITPDEALQRLKEGNERYVKGLMKRQDFSAERGALKGGQNPFAGILSCADSRVAPELAFDTGRGDLFVVRLAGNFLDEDGLASLEYAVKFLGTPLLVVLGHEKCGAIDAAIKTVKDNATLPGHLPELIEGLKPAVEAVLNKPGDLLENAIDENVRLTVAKLKGASPIISQYVEEKKIRVIGGVYQFSDGRIDWMG